ncbi:hypothetical protein ACE1SV_66780 [Streptomyces sp. E-15]
MLGDWAHVHRMNSDAPPPAPGGDKPTIYIGTSEDVAFGKLKHGLLQGQSAPGDEIRVHVAVDEADEAFVYANPTYILSEGAQREAAPETVSEVNWAGETLKDSLDRQVLDETDFGLRSGHLGGGGAELTEAGRARLEAVLERGLSEQEVHRLNMAALAQWVYKPKIHYAVHDGKIFIIDQNSHKVLYDPITSSESRWNNGLAQAIEHHLGLTVRSDSDSSRSLTAQDLVKLTEFGQTSGASGTVKGHDFGALGLSDTVRDVNRYYEHRLEFIPDRISEDLQRKLDEVVDDTLNGYPADRRPPQLILAHRNDLVGEISARLEAAGVEHTAIDANWFLEKGRFQEDAFEEAIKHAGEPGKVTVINMTGGRGVDIKVVDAAKELGGLHVRITGRSHISADIDIQAENRAARGGDPGRVTYYGTPHDDIYALSPNPDVHHVVIRYTDAARAHQEAPAPETAQALGHAEQDLRDLVPRLQDAAAAARRAQYTHDALANAPPAGTTGQAPATDQDTPTPPPEHPVEQPVEQSGTNSEADVQAPTTDTTDTTDTTGPAGTPPGTAGSRDEMPTAPTSLLDALSGLRDRVEARERAYEEFDRQLAESPPELRSPLVAERIAAARETFADAWAQDHPAQDPAELTATRTRAVTDLTAHLTSAREALTAGEQAQAVFDREVATVVVPDARIRTAFQSSPQAAALAEDFRQTVADSSGGTEAAVGEFRQRYAQAHTAWTAERRAGAAFDNALRTTAPDGRRIHLADGLAQWSAPVRDWYSERLVSLRESYVTERAQTLAVADETERQTRLDQLDADARQAALYEQQQAQTVVAYNRVLADHTARFGADAAWDRELAGWYEERRRALAAPLTDRLHLYSAQAREQELARLDAQTAALRQVAESRHRAFQDFERLLEGHGEHTGPMSHAATVDWTRRHLAALRDAYLETAQQALDTALPVPFPAAHPQAAAEDDWRVPAWQEAQRELHRHYADLLAQDRTEDTTTDATATDADGGATARERETAFDEAFRQWAREQAPGVSEERLAAVRERVRENPDRFGEAATERPAADRLRDAFSLGAARELAAVRGEEAFEGAFRRWGQRLADAWRGRLADGTPTPFELVAEMAVSVRELAAGDFRDRWEGMLQDTLVSGTDLRTRGGEVVRESARMLRGLVSGLEGEFDRYALRFGQLSRLDTVFEDLADGAFRDRLDQGGRDLLRAFDAEDTEVSEPGRARILEDARRTLREAFDQVFPDAESVAGLATGGTLPQAWQDRVRTVLDALPGRLALQAAREAAILRSQDAVADAVASWADSATTTGQAFLDRFPVSFGQVRPQLRRTLDVSVATAVNDHFEQLFGHDSVASDPAEVRAGLERWNTAYGELTGPGRLHTWLTVQHARDSVHAASARLFDEQVERWQAAHGSQALSEADIARARAGLGERLLAAFDAVFTGRPVGPDELAGAVRQWDAVLAEQARTLPAHLDFESWTDAALHDAARSFDTLRPGEDTARQRWEEYAEDFRADFLAAYELLWAPERLSRSWAAREAEHADAFGAGLQAARLHAQRGDDKGKGRAAGERPADSLPAELRGLDHGRLAALIGKAGQLVPPKLTISGEAETEALREAHRRRVLEVAAVLHTQDENAARDRARELGADPAPTGIRAGARPTDTTRQQTGSSSTGQGASGQRPSGPGQSEAQQRREQMWRSRPWSTEPTPEPAVQASQADWPTPQQLAPLFAHVSRMGPSEHNGVVTFGSIADLALLTMGMRLDRAQTERLHREYRLAVPEPAVDEGVPDAVHPANVTAAWEHFVLHGHLEVSSPSRLAGFVEALRQRDYGTIPQTTVDWWNSVGMRWGTRTALRAAQVFLGAGPTPSRVPPDETIRAIAVPRWPARFDLAHWGRMYAHVRERSNDELAALRWVLGDVWSTSILLPGSRQEAWRRRLWTLAATPRPDLRPDGSVLSQDQIHLVMQHLNHLEVHAQSPVRFDNAAKLLVRLLQWQPTIELLEWLNGEYVVRFPQRSQVQHVAVSMAAAARAAERADAERWLSFDPEAAVRPRAERARIPIPSEVRSEAQAQVDAWLQARSQARIQARGDAEARALTEAEERARAEAEERARVEAQERARVEAVERARVEAEERARAEAAERARADVDPDEEARIFAENKRIWAEAHERERAERERAKAERAQARAEAQERAKAERAQARAEARQQAEAERARARELAKAERARIQAEAQQRAQARAEAERAEAERAQARAEAAERARADVDPDEEARIFAENKRIWAEAHERERAERERAKAERAQARAEAQERAKAERAQARAEAQERAKAERAQARAEARQQAEAERARARAEAERAEAERAQARAEAERWISFDPGDEARLRAERAQAQAEAERAQARTEAGAERAQVEAEAERWISFDPEAEARLEAERAQARAEAQRSKAERARARELADVERARARAEAEWAKAERARARAEDERAKAERAQARVEAQMRLKAKRAQARAEARQQAEAEEQARTDDEERTWLERLGAAALERAGAEERARVEAEARARAERAQVVAEERARAERAREAEERARAEAEERARVVAEERARVERARLEAEERARVERARVEAEERSRLEAEESTRAGHGPGSTDEMEELFGPSPEPDSLFGPSPEPETRSVTPGAPGAPIDVDSREWSVALWEQQAWRSRPWESEARPQPFARPTWRDYPGPDVRESLFADLRRSGQETFGTVADRLFRMSGVRLDEAQMERLHWEYQSALPESAAEPPVPAPARGDGDTRGHSSVNGRSKDQQEAARLHYQEHHHLEVNRTTYPSLGGYVETLRRRPGLMGLSQEVVDWWEWAGMRWSTRHMLDAVRAYLEGRVPSAPLPDSAIRAIPVPGRPVTVDVAHWISTLRHVKHNVLTKEHRQEIREVFGEVWAERILSTVRTDRGAADAAGSSRPGGRQTGTGADARRAGASAGAAGVRHSTAGLSSGQEEVLAQRGLRAVGVPADGDCLMYAVLATAPEVFAAFGSEGGVSSAQEVRAVVADALTAELGQPVRPLWDLVDVQAQHNQAEDTARQAVAEQERDGAVLDAEQREALLAQFRDAAQTELAERWDDTFRQALIARLRTSGQYDDASGDIAPVLIAHIFGLAVEVIGETAVPYQVGPQNGRRTVLVRLSRETVGFDHWLATAPTAPSSAQDQPPQPQQQPEEPEQQPQPQEPEQQPQPQQPQEPEQQPQQQPHGLTAETTMNTTTDGAPGPGELEGAAEPGGLDLSAFDMTGVDGAFDTAGVGLDVFDFSWFGTGGGTDTRTGPGRQSAPGLGDLGLGDLDGVAADTGREQHGATGGQEERTVQDPPEPDVGPTGMDLDGPEFGTTEPGTTEPGTTDSGTTNPDAVNWSALLDELGLPPADMEVDGAMFGLPDPMYGWPGQTEFYPDQSMVWPAEPETAPQTAPDAQTHLWMGPDAGTAEIRSAWPASETDASAVGPAGVRMSAPEAAWDGLTGAGGPEETLAMPGTGEAPQTHSLPPESTDSVPPDQLDARILLDGAGRPVGIDFVPTGESRPRQVRESEGRSIWRLDFDPGVPPTAAPAVVLYQRGEPVRVPLRAFADLVAGNLPDRHPIWLVTAHGARYGLDLARAVADRAGVRVYSHTGRVDLAETVFGDLAVATVDGQDGLPDGHWVYVDPAEQEADGPESGADETGPENYVTSVSGERFHFRSLLMTPLADSDGRLIGHVSMPDFQFREFEPAFMALPERTRFGVESAEGVDYGIDGWTPWSRSDDARHFLAFHGFPDTPHALLHTRDGRYVAFDGEQTAALLRRRASFEAFRRNAAGREDSAVIAAVCYSGRSRSIVPTSYVQQLADNLGLPVSGPTGPLAVGFEGLLIAPTDGLAGWRTARPGEPDATFEGYAGLDDIAAAPGASDRGALLALNAEAPPTDLPAGSGTEASDPSTGSAVQREPEPEPEPVAEPPESGSPGTVDARALIDGAGRPIGIDLAPPADLRPRLLRIQGMIVWRVTFDPGIPAESLPSVVVYKGGRPVRVTLAAFAELVAESGLVGAPVALVTDHGARYGLDLARAVADRAGVRVYSHTGRVDLVETGLGDLAVDLVDGRDGLPRGHWVYVDPAEQEADGPESGADETGPENYVTSVTGERFHFRSLLMTPLADSDGRMIGHISLPDHILREHGTFFQALPSNTRFGVESDDGTDYGLVGRNPWGEDRGPRHLVVAHGPEEAPHAEIFTRDGRAVRFDGEQVAAALRRRASFRAFQRSAAGRTDAAVITATCYAARSRATHPTTYIQRMADGLGLPVVGPTGEFRVGARESFIVPSDGLAGWRTARPDDPDMTFEGHEGLGEPPAAARSGADDAARPDGATSDQSVVSLAAPERATLPDDVLEPRPQPTRSLDALLAALGVDRTGQQDRQQDPGSGAAETPEQARDRRDAGMVFAPPAYAVSRDVRRGAGAETYAFADDRLPAAIRDGVLELLPQGRRAAVGPLLDEYFAGVDPDDALRQAVADRLTLVLRPPGGSFAVTVRLRSGDWTQLTDPLGEPVGDAATRDGDQGQGPSRSAGQVRNRRESTVADRSVDHRPGTALPLPFSQALSYVPVVGQASAAVQALFSGFAKTSAFNSSATLDTTRTIRGAGAPRTVRFLHDVAVGLTLHQAGQDPLHRQSVVERSLIADYPRRAVRALPRPAGVRHATSGLWAGRSGETGASTAELRLAPAPNRWDAAGRRAAPDRTGAPVDVPALSWVDSVTGAADYRAAVFAAVDPALADPAAPSFETLDAFAGVGSLLSGLHDAAAGGYWSAPVATADGRSDAVRVAATFHNPRTVQDTDELARLDVEDVRSGTLGAASVQSDALGTGIGPALTLAAAALGIPAQVPLPTLSYGRSVQYTRQGQQSGQLEVRRLRHTDEPTTVVEFDVRLDARGLGGRTGPETWITARLRMPVAEAERLEHRTRDTTGPHRAATPADPETVARTAGGRRLRLPALLRDWLPPTTRIGEVDARDAAQVLDRALDLVHERFPGYLAPRAPEPAAAATAGGPVLRWPAGTPQPHQVTNHLALADAFGPAALARRAHLTAGQAHTVVLTRPGPKGGEQIRVTVRASLDPDAFTYVRSRRGQTEVVHGESLDLLSSALRRWKVAAGIGITIGDSTVPDEGISPPTGRIAPQVSWSHSVGETGGFSASGTLGGGSLWLAEFDGPVTFHLNAEPEPGTAQAGERPAVAEPVTVRAALVTAEDLTLEEDAAGRFRSALDFESTADGTGPARRAPRTEDPAPQPSWVPAEGERLPQDTLHMVRADHLFPHVESLLEQAGVRALDPADEAALRTAVAGLPARIHDLTGAPYPLWNRPVGRNAYGMPRRVEVSVRARVTRLTAIGESDHAFHYDRTLATALLHSTESDDRMAVDAAVTGAGPHTGVLPDGSDPTDFAGTQVDYGYGRSAPVSVERTSSGRDDRLHATVGSHVWAEAPTEFTVTVRRWDESPVGLLGNLSSRRYSEQEITGDPVPAPGLALLPVASARARGLAEDPAGAAGTDRDGDAATALAPVNVLRGDGFDQAVLLNVPDLVPFVRDLLPRLREALPREHADAVEAELWKVATQRGTAALLETMVTGLPILVPNRDELSTSMARVTLTARLLAPRAVGREAGEHVLVSAGLRVREQTNTVTSTSRHEGAARTGESSARLDSLRAGHAGPGLDLRPAFNHSDTLQTRTHDRQDTGVLHVLHPHVSAFDVELTAELDVHRALSSGPSALGMVLPVIGRGSRYPLGTRLLHGELRLGYGDGLTQIDAAPASRPPTLVEAAATEPRRLGPPLPEDVLREAYPGTVGDLRGLREAAESLFTGPEARYSTSPATHSWQGGLFLLNSKIAAIFSPPYMNRRFPELAAGGTLREPVTLPGTGSDSVGLLEISADVRGLRELPPGGDGTLPDAVVTDPSRSVLLTAGRLDRPVRIGGPLDGEAATGSGGRTDAPTLTLTGPDAGRSFSRVEATSVTWHIVHRPASGKPRAVDVTVTDQAAVLYVPTERLDELLASRPTRAVTSEFVPTAPGGGLGVPAGDTSAGDAAVGSRDDGEGGASAPAPERERALRGTAQLPPGEQGGEAGSDVSPAVDYGLVHPDDRDWAVESRPGDFLWRYSDVSPEQAFRNGFRADALSELVTLEYWVRDNPPGPYVSTTQDRDLYWRSKRYRYEINTSRNPDPTGVDVNATFDAWGGNNQYFAEREVAFTGSIAPEAVVLVYDTKEDRSGTWDARTEKVTWQPGEYSYAEAGDRGVPVAVEDGSVDGMAGLPDGWEASGSVARPVRGRTADAARGADPSAVPARDRVQEEESGPGHGLRADAPSASAPARQAEQAPGETDGELVGRGEVRTNRWLPFGARPGQEPRGAEAFTFVREGADGRMVVRRPAASGERTDVGYEWALYRRGSLVGEVLLLTRRIHLVADGVSVDELRDLEHGLAEAVEELLNAPGYRLPALQPDRVAGQVTRGPLLRVRVRVTGEEAAAHAVVRVRPGLPERGAMVQGVWYAGVRPAAFVHEIVHGLGVLDDKADPRVLLTPGGRGVQQLPEAASSLMGTVRGDAAQELVLTQDHLRQIAEVFAPYAHQGTGPVGAVEPAPHRSRPRTGRPRWTTAWSTRTTSTTWWRACLVNSCGVSRTRNRRWCSGRDSVRTTRRSG